jgi:hypothetical protein
MSECINLYPVDSSCVEMATELPDLGPIFAGIAAGELACLVVKQQT